MASINHKVVQPYDSNSDNGWYSYTCGHCNTNVAGICFAGYHTAYGTVKWLLCPSCGDGSVLTRQGFIHPSVLFGPEIVGLPSNVKEVYQEARNCMSVNAYTACELVCRTILMYVAVEKGAKEKQTFVDYISYFQDKQLITPNMKPWVDIIRGHGGKSAHTLEKPDKNRAESTLMFTAELLRLVYEMEHLANKYTTKP